MISAFRLVCVFALLFRTAIWANQAAECDGPDKILSLSVETTSEKLKVGQSLSLFLTFKNISSDPIYLEYSGATFGSKALNIIAQKDGKRYAIEPAHFDRLVEDLRFDFKSLMPNESFKTDVAEINGTASGVLRLPLVEPGLYNLWIEYRSDGQTIEGTIWPIWRGCIRSNSLHIRIDPPPNPELDHWRSQLNQCLQSKDCEDVQAIQYFQQVRDPQAADVLVKLIRKHPTGFLVLEIANAIRNQGRKEDSAVLLSIASNPTLDENTKKFLGQLSQELQGLN